jgi:diketogulonate reductase-like aldo/keto reductase
MADTAPGDEHRIELRAEGVVMPRLGLGVWQVPDGPDAERAVSWALEAGYRHIDTAQGYGNEPSVGRAIASSGIPRQDLFLTTKFLPGAADPVAEAERSLERLGIDRLDLYLVHWPGGGPTRAWPGMERALERGVTRAIGVSNFDVRELAAVTDAAHSPPAVNQIQLSPFHHRRELIAACDRLGIAVEAYSPLTTGRDLDNRTVAEVARRNDRTPAQVMLRWGLQHGFAVLPKSVHRERIVENAHIFDFELSADDMAALDALDRTGGTGRAHERPWWTVAGRARERVARIVKR